MHNSHQSISMSDENSQRIKTIMTTMWDAVEDEDPIDIMLAAMAIVQDYVQMASDILKETDQ